MIRSQARRATAVGAALVVGAALASAGAVARGEQERPPTPAETARIQAKMLKRSDVPRALHVDQGWEFTIKAHEGQHQSLCDKNGEDIQGRETNMLYQIELGETNTLVDPTALEQKVWPYPSRRAAMREWTYLTQQVRYCTGRSSWTGETGNDNVQYLSWGWTDETVQGRHGIWIFIDSRSAGANPDTEDGGYYVLFPVGSTVQSVEYDFPDRRGLPARMRTMVNGVAVTVADRWLSMP